MDGFINSSIEKQTIYEIYRACRLCGAGAGYKMPIMQNVVHLDGAEVELKQKIRECVQIEVHQEDKMPPLICELCVDKVNDFYEFLEMCRQTNKRTRLRLGLPPQTMPRGASDAGDCILGVTEPVYLNEDSNESLLKPRMKKGRFTKESKSTKKTSSKQNDVRSLRSQQASPPPRASKRSREEDIALSNLQKTSTRRSVLMPKSILRKDIEVKTEEEWCPTRSKRSRDSKPDTIKRVKIVEKQIPKPSPKSDFKCKTCKAQFNNSKALNNHMRTHNRTQSKYRSTTRQDKKNSCTKCKKDFSSKLSLDRHKCMKCSDNKCVYCGRHISNSRNLATHERACQSRKEFKISPKLLKQLRPIQIRIQRCDPLLKKVGERYDVSAVDCNFGLDKNSIYPYLTSLRIKTEPPYMVNIHNTIDEFDLNQDYVHWDSDSSASDLEMSDLKEKSVGSLANLSLKTIFSHKFLGKVPKRKRRVKSDKAYDSILNFDSDVRLGIDNIINSLDNDKTVNDTKDNDNDSLFGDDKTPAVSNDDFDSLFSSNNDSESIRNDKTNADDGKCEIMNKNNEIENEKSENGNEINNDSLTELNSNDIIKNAQENDKSESSEVSGSVNSSDINNDKVLVIKESEHTEEESLISNKTTEDNEIEDNKKNILTNNDNIDKVDSKFEKSSKSLYKKETEQTDKVIENNELTDIETEKSTAIINDKNQESNISVNEKDICIDGTLNTESSGINDVENNEFPANDSKINDTSLNETASNNDNKLDKGALHVNGDDKMDLDDLKDISDSEIDDSRLMEAIDEQIGEKETDCKGQDNERDDISVVKSADLESILSEKLVYQ